MTTAAAIDRVVHHSIILELNVPSYRAEAAQERKAPKAWSPAQEPKPATRDTDDVGTKKKDG
jgi:hypothetical protein